MSSAGRSRAATAWATSPGTTEYVDDVRYPGMLHLKMVRSPLVHARIRGIDFSEAEKVPGFVRALTAKDVPKNVYTILCLIGVEPDEEQVLRRRSGCRYRGEPIAAIVAETEEAALEAVAAVQLDLEELPAVFDVEEALKPGRADRHALGHELPSSTRAITAGASATATSTPASRAGRPRDRGHLPDHADRARADRDDRLHRRARGRTAGSPSTPTRRRSTSRSTTRRSSCRSPGNRLHFMGGTVGGGFGGKVDVIIEPIATLAAMKTGRPVRYVYSREEEMRCPRRGRRAGSGSATA